MVKKSRKSIKDEKVKASKHLSANNSSSNVSSQSLDKPLKPILSKKKSRDSNGSKNVTFLSESAKKRNSLGSKNVSVTEEIDSDDDKFPLNLSNEISDSLIEISTDSENEDSDGDYEFLVDSSASDDEDGSDDDDIFASLWAGEDDDDESDNEKPSTVVFEEITEKETNEITKKTVDKLKSIQATVNGRTSLKRKRDDSLTESPSNKRVLSEKQVLVKNRLTESKTSTKSIGKSKLQEKLDQLKKEGKILTKAETRKLKKAIKAQERKKNGKKPKVTMSPNQAEKFLNSTNKRLQELQSRSIYIRPIPQKCDYNLLNQAFPDMTGCHIPLKLSSKNKKVPRGFAFIEFSSTQEAEKQLKQLAKTECMQNILVVLYPIVKTRPAIDQLLIKTASPRQIKTSYTKNEVTKEISRYDLTKLHVSGLPSVVDSEQIRSIIDGCKRIDLPSRKNNHFGYCVAEFQDEFKAKNAFWHCHGKNLNNAPLTVTFVIKRKKKD